MPGFHGTTRVPPLRSMTRRLSSFCNSTPSIVTFHLGQETPAFICISNNYRRLHIRSPRHSRYIGLTWLPPVSKRSFSLKRSATTMDQDGTTHTSNSSSNHNSKNDGGVMTTTTSTTKPKQPIYFGPFEVTNQVFLTTPYSFALVNLKPLLPGHVLVCPLRPAKRLTDLSAVEMTDLFSSVQRVQRMLARYYFSSSSPSTPTSSNNNNEKKTQAVSGSEEEGGGGGLNSLCTLGSFNIAVQDGPEAGQTVSHVHVHVIPRIRGSTAKDAETPSDELYDRMAGEDGNVGGAHWDRAVQQQNQNHHGMDVDGAAAGARRPEPGGQFPSIEDSQRLARGMEEMEREAEVFRGVLREMEEDGW